MTCSTFFPSFVKNVEAKHNEFSTGNFTILGCRRLATKILEKGFNSNFSDREQFVTKGSTIPNGFKDQVLF